VVRPHVPPHLPYPDLATRQQFAANLRAKRLELGISQRKLGKAFGRSYGIVAHWERCMGIPTYEHAAAICTFLGIPNPWTATAHHAAGSRSQLPAAAEGSEV